MTALTATRSDSGTRVTAPCGEVVGRRENGVHVFRGIPYAEPPVGDLRFAPPAPRLPRRRIDATEFGPVSLQDIDPLPAAIPGTEHNFYHSGARADENCLSLNIWTPGTRAPSTGGLENEPPDPQTSGPQTGAPVYVFLHGGAFLYGSGTGPWISGENHAREHGIVVVTINYRLGLLGGLFLGDYDTRSANLAIQDQIQALRWVQENIAAFGGDASRVTVGGQSAGGLSALALLAAPEATGLFHRVIVESAHAEAMMSVEHARRSTIRVLERLQIDPAAPDVLEQLREVSVFRIAAVQREFGMAVRTFPLVVDGHVLASSPIDVIEAGARRDVDLLIGNTRDEDRLFSVTGWASSDRTIETTVADLLTDPDDRERAAQMYDVLQILGMDDEALSYAITGDHGWAEPVRRIALAHAGSGGRTYHFEFAWASSAADGAVGAAHLVDLPFFFGTLDAPGVAALLGEEAASDPETIALGRRVSASVAEFVRSGDLSGSALGPWRRYTDDDRATMILDRHAEIVVDHLADRLDFWAEQRGRSITPLSRVGLVE